MAPTGRFQRLKGTLRTVGRTLKRNPNMILGMVFVIGAALIAIFAPFIAAQDPLLLKPADRLMGPSSAHFFGTDQMGRDTFARTIYGSRISLLVGSSVAVLSVVFGLFFGLIAGYYRSMDAVVMRFMDGLMAFPSLLLAIALMAMLGASVQNVIITLTVVDTPRMVRVVRASVLSLRERDFVEAARAVGARPWRIMGIHILPNTIAPVIVQATYIFALAILVEAGLSFLGAGTPPAIPSWGNIMGEGRMYVQMAVWLTFFPGLFLSLTVLGINLIGDGLRDSLDPKLARRM
jgi:peptide/nickel transport system permease protein